jgi:hypothetical protein
MKEIKISNKIAYALTAVILLIAIGTTVIAYGGNNPERVGHTWNEIEGIVGEGNLSLINCHDIAINSSTEDTCATENNGEHGYTKCPAGEVMTGIDTTRNLCMGFTITSYECCELAWEE